MTDAEDTAGTVIDEQALQADLDRFLELYESDGETRVFLKRIIGEFPIPVMDSSSAYFPTIPTSSGSEWAERTLVTTVCVILLANSRVFTNQCLSERQEIWEEYGKQQYLPPDIIVDVLKRAKRELTEEWISPHFIERLFRSIFRPDA